MNAEEPSYLAFARANNKALMNSSFHVVRELVNRIDRDAKVIAELERRLDVARA